jgi:alkylhydroperoxidase/carboxymuconolactone decarboxylase family protein YurZ
MSLKFAKYQFIAELGEHAWNDSWQSILNLSPELFEASLDLGSIPKRKTHRFLTTKFHSLCSLAVDSASTHLFVPGIQEHIQTAIRNGATAAEIVELI